MFDPEEIDYALLDTADDYGDPIPDSEEDEDDEVDEEQGGESEEQGDEADE
jgi:hypothetical protein